MSTDPIALTQFAHGAGCGCKIAPQVLKEILITDVPEEENKKLLVGNKSNDDAAVYDLGDGKALIATTDFFMPVVDDAYEFGKIAAANAISDVYAMGGKPLLALAILGWPVDKLPAALARRVVEGARVTCALAGIPLAGGHSIDSPEPVFGLSVNGTVNLEHLKRNDTALEGDLLFLTKPIGTGILSTAQKRNVLLEADKTTLLKQLAALNKIGEALGQVKGVTAMTDVTGFGLMGHLLEMATGSGLTAVVQYQRIPKMAGLSYYLQQNTVPDATFRNWNAYQSDVIFEENVDMAEAFSVMPDPQTNGGLLIAVRPGAAEKVISLLREHGLETFIEPIGQMVSKQDKRLRVQ
jgi:selenide,water dikinase